MTWQILSDSLIPATLRFLGPREHVCTGFTEKLVTNGHLGVPPANQIAVVVRRGRDGSVTGAILQVRSGLYYPVLHEAQPLVERPALELLRKHSRRIYSVIGRTADVNAFESALRRHPVQWLEYHLMTQERTPVVHSQTRIPGNLAIKRSTPKDARLLSDLQRKYEIEEVLLPGNTFDPVSSFRHLKSALASQLIYHASLNSRPIAKAGTNARGIFYDQIGGVFTESAFRSRGVGTMLMLRLLSVIASENKSATLFVKKDNGPALSMYRNLGFGVLDGFRISYYR